MLIDKITAIINNNMILLSNILDYLVSKKLYLDTIRLSYVIILLEQFL